MPSFARKGDDSTAPEDMSKLLDQGIDLAGSNYDRKKNYDFRLIEIVREYAQNLPLVTCGGGEIQQVFLNILRNSAEAIHGVMDLGSSEKSFLILRIRKDSEAGMLRIEIEDNGPGMKEETRKRIFEPFFTTKATDQGTGLGLSVSYFIITETHRGKMSVEPTCGVGTKFITRLPIEGKSLWISQNRASWFSTIMMLFAKA